MSVPSVCLVILDGWGLAEPGPGNAVELADTPVFDELWESYPHSTLAASGPAVGLPEGQMGNSEVGHLNLGAGAVVKQDLVRIDEAIESGAFFENEVLRAACHAGPRLHLLGLVSEGASTRASGTSAPASSWPGERGSRTWCCTRSRTAATRSRSRVPASWRRRRLWLSEHGGRVATVTGALLRHGPRPPLGPHPARLRRDRARARRSTPRRRGEEAVRARVRAGRDRRVHQADARGRRGADPAGDSVFFFNFRPDRARQLTVRPLDERSTSPTRR